MKVIAGALDREGIVPHLKWGLYSMVNIIISTMWGITMLLMRLADYIQGRKDKRTCSLCDYVAKNEKELDKHVHQLHGDLI